MSAGPTHGWQGALSFAGVGNGIVGRTGWPRKSDLDDAAGFVAEPILQDISDTTHHAIPRDVVRKSIDKDFRHGKGLYERVVSHCAFPRQFFWNCHNRTAKELSRGKSWQAADFRFRAAPSAKTKHCDASSLRHHAALCAVCASEAATSRVHRCPTPTMCNENRHCFGFCKKFVDHEHLQRRAAMTGDRTTECAA